MRSKFFYKRKKSGTNCIKNENKKVKLVEEISSDEDFSEQDTKHIEESSDEETAQEKKLRIARQYISQIEEDCETREDARQKLKEDILKEKDRLCKKRAHEFANVPEPATVFRKHKLSITALAVSPCEKYFFSASKDSCIMKWDLVEKKKLQMINYVEKGSEGPGHSYPILALAISSDGKFLASGCEGGMIKIWNTESLDLLQTFTGHKGAITGLVFQKGTNNLISASKDRSLKVWNMDNMAYVETLFGHQDEVAGIDSCGESVITCGSKDGTIRLWKIAEESQLVYNGDGGSIDCLTSSGQNFVSGGEDGTLHLWRTQKKKPRSKVAEAHGIDEESDAPNWIVCVTSLKNSDLIATGSKDGFVRLWKLDDEAHSIVPVSEIPVVGFINCLEFSPSGDYLIVGVGQEHRCGRWWRCKDAKNSIIVYRF